MDKYSLHFDRSEVDDLHSLMLKYDIAEFESSHRSTVALLSLVKDHQPTFDLILADCKIQNANLHFEYTVKPPKGRGKPSHTDLMVRHNSQALAIEAKWTEPRYEEVHEWVFRGPNPANRIAVLEGWTELLQQKAQCSLTSDALQHAIYQMVHRAASAVAAGDPTSLAYMKFSTVPNFAANDIYSDLLHLHGALGSPSSFPFHLIEVYIRPTAAFEKIRSLPKASMSAEPVQEAIAGSRLFEIPGYRIRTIPF